MTQIKISDNVFAKPDPVVYMVRLRSLIVMYSDKAAKI